MVYRKALFVLVFVVVAAASALFIPSQAVAGEADKTILMFVPDTDWPPYLISDPQYPGAGVLVDVLKAVAEPLGYTIETKRLPNKRGWMLLNKRNVDVHAKALEWVKNPDEYLWTDSFMMNEDVMLYSAASKLKYTKPEDMYGKTIVCIDGFFYPVLEEHFGPGKINKVCVSSPYAMLELVDLGRADAALVNRGGTQWLFRNRLELKPERFRMDDTAFDSAGYRYLFANDESWQPFIGKFNRELKAMKKDGRLKAILDQYR